ncbi:hypothetical protein D9M69_590630 [compost metagenome]
MSMDFDLDFPSQPDHLQTSVLNATPAPGDASPAMQAAQDAPTFDMSEETPDFGLDMDFPAEAISPAPAAKASLAGSPELMTFDLNDSASIWTHQQRTPMPPAMVRARRTPWKPSSRWPRNSARLVTSKVRDRWPKKCWRKRLARSRRKLAPSWPIWLEPLSQPRTEPLGSATDLAEFRA